MSSQNFHGRLEEISVRVSCEYPISNRCLQSLVQRQLKTCLHQRVLTTVYIYSFSHLAASRA